MKQTGEFPCKKCNRTYVSEAKFRQHICYTLAKGGIVEQHTLSPLEIREVVGEKDIWNKVMDDATFLDLHSQGLSGKEICKIMGMNSGSAISRRRVVLEVPANHPPPSNKKPIATRNDFIKVYASQYLEKGD